MDAGRETVGTDFGTQTRRAALDEWRRHARAEDRGPLGRHPIATSVAVGVAVGLALAILSNRRRIAPPQARSRGRNARQNP